MNNNQIKIDFNKYKNLESVLEVNLSHFLSQISNSKDIINLEKINIEHAILDFEGVVEDAELEFGFVETNIHINKYRNIAIKLRERWDLVS